MSTAVDPLLTGPAVEIARAIRERRASALEVLELHLARIAAENPRLHAIVTLTDERARAAAVEADRRAASREELGPLHGVPFTVKDMIATAGIRTTAGSLLLRDFVPERTAPAIERLERAGAILLGKTNCPEFALHAHTWSPLFGATLNPLDETVTPGGSSGGDAAAVASGCAAFGIGSDFGASTRWPAHCTGIATLRPTPGIVPLTGTLPYGSSDPLPSPNSMAMATQGNTMSPLARSARDLWPIVRAMAGPDGRDLHAVPVALGDPGRVEVAGLACAWCEGEGDYPVRDDLVSAVGDAADCLGGLGLRIRRETPPGIAGAYPLYAALRDADGMAVQAALARGREGELAESNREILAGLEPTTVGELQRLAGERDERRARIVEFMEEWPILLLPVATEPAFTVRGESMPPSFHLVAPSRVIALFNLPVAVVRCGTSREGLPIGVQIVGRPFADHEVVAVACALEEELRAA